MTTSHNDGMFPVSAVLPGASGQLAASYRVRLEDGVRLCRSGLANKHVAVFDHVTEFDYDGTWSSIETVRGFDDRAAAEEFGADRLKELVDERVEQGSWQAADVPSREVNVLPATGSVMPGRFPGQFGFAALRANEYETCYFRTYLVEAESDAGILEKILSFDGLEEDLVSYLIKLGEKV